MSISISSTITHTPTGRFAQIATAILGAHYQLSLVFVGEARAKSLNQNTRGKDYIPNVLSFTLSPTDGEIYICPAVAKREAKKFSMTPDHYLHYLLIHGCLHLTGLDHGKKMTELEEHYIRQFSLQ